MHWEHKFFVDKDGVVHETDGFLGERSQMLCEFNGVFRFKMHELQPADTPVTCVECLAQGIQPQNPVQQMRPKE